MKSLFIFKLVLFGITIFTLFPYITNKHSNRLFQIIEDNPPDIINVNKSSLSSCGVKLLNLVLTDPKSNKSVEVINADLDKDFTGSGSFFLYPFIGRLDNTKNFLDYMGVTTFDFPTIDPQTGLPIHGLFVQTERVLVNKDHNSLTYVAKNTQYFNKFPKFSEKYTLSDDSLEIRTTFENTSNQVQYFGYSHHPYISINNQSIDNFHISSNIEKHVKLNALYVPQLDKKGDLIFDDFKLNGWINGRHIDDAFHTNLGSNVHDNTYVKIKDNANNISIQVECVLSAENISFPFTTVYTPPNRKAIAVEFGSSPINAFNILFPHYLTKIEPGQILAGVTKITIK